MQQFWNCFRKTWFKFRGSSPSKCWPNSMPVFVCDAIGKNGFLKKSQNGPVTQTFFSKMCSVKPVRLEELKKIRVFMFKIPDFSLVPRLCKQAGLDLVSARKDFDPRTPVSGDLRLFDMTVRCAVHCAGATLNNVWPARTLVAHWQLETHPAANFDRSSRQRRKLTNQQNS